jgi:hypothetical protein
MFPNEINGKAINYKPGEALSVPGVLGSQISRQSAQKGSKDVSPANRPHLSARK